VVTIILADTASSSGGFAGLFSALGLNWQTFILDTIAFLVTVWILGKYVYPPLMKALDAKQSELEAAARLEDEAKNSLAKAQDAASEIVSEARSSADEILATAKDQGNAQIEAARLKATVQAERTISEAREQLAKDVNAARTTLKNDTAKLVAGATETILGEKLDGKGDASLIERALEGVK
jgi:F-type H+-transporting ATPase subunit b